MFTRLSDSLQKFLSESLRMRLLNRMSEPNVASVGADIERLIYELSDGGSPVIQNMLYNHFVHSSLTHNSNGFIPETPDSTIYESDNDDLNMNVSNLSGQMEIDDIEIRSSQMSTSSVTKTNPLKRKCSDENADTEDGSPKKIKIVKIQGKIAFQTSEIYNISDERT